MKRYINRTPKKSIRASRYVKASLGMTKDEMWDALMDMGVSEQTIDVVTSINGYSEETMLDILYAVFGYRDFDQLDDEE